MHITLSLLAHTTARAGSAWSDNGYTSIVKNSADIQENRNTMIETAFDMSSNIFSGAVANTTINSYCGQIALQILSVIRRILYHAPLHEASLPSSSH